MSVLAGDKEEAKQLFDAGLKLMHLDDFAGASANFERSVALYPTQNSLFNLANCVSAARRPSFAGALDEAGWVAWQMRLRGESKSGNGEQAG
jgi:hypothetical protein